MLQPQDQWVLSLGWSWSHSRVLLSSDDAETWSWEIINPSLTNLRYLSSVTIKIMGHAMTNESGVHGRNGNPRWCPNTNPLTETQAKMVLSHTIDSLDRLVFAALTITTFDSCERKFSAYFFWDILYEDFSRTLATLDVPPLVPPLWPKS